MHAEEETRKLVLLGRKRDRWKERACWFRSEEVEGPPRVRAEVEEGGEEAGRGAGSARPKDRVGLESQAPGAVRVRSAPGSLVPRREPGLRGEMHPGSVPQHLIPGR